MTRSAQGAKTLPGKYYTDQAIYELETRNIFSKKWLYVGRGGEIPRPGDYFLLETEGESIIILRDRNLKVRAFYNICRHRGTKLCEVATGKFGQTIQCIYHAWTYRLDGTLHGAPNMHEVASFEKSDYPLLQVASAEWEGCLFINLSDNPEPFEQAFAPLISKFSKWQMTELITVHRIVYEVAANWKLVFQNYSECYHCPSLHPALNRLTPYRNSSNDLMEGPFLGGPMHFAEDSDSMTMTGRVCAAPLAQLEEADLRLAYYYTVQPNMLLSLFPDYVMIHRVERDGPAKSRVVCDWLFDAQAAVKPDFDPSGAIEFWNITNQQDWQVSELSQLGVSSRAYQPGPYAELESMIAAWDREYLRTLKENE